MRCLLKKKTLRLEKPHLYKNLYMPVPSSIIHEKCNQPECPLMDRWINQC